MVSSMILTEWTSYDTQRLTLRPSLSCMPFQFWKESLMSVFGEMVTMVLSKLRTFTVVSVISSTLPFTPAFSTVIQSPFRSMSLEVRWIPATSPVMVS